MRGGEERLFQGRTFCWGREGREGADVLWNSREEKNCRGHLEDLLSIASSLATLKDSSYVSKQRLINALNDQ